MRLATSLALLKLRDFYITVLLINKWHFMRNGTTYNKLECCQLALRSALSRNFFPILNTDDAIYNIQA